MPVLVGARLGPYEVLAPIGSGGMGHVYRARDHRLGRDVAIKVLPDGVVADADALRRFEREARAVAALNHPNILAVHDIGNDGGVVYLVTELLEGTTLREQLAAGPLPPRRAIDYAIQVARGLGAAHERGIVHRDVKPDNLFLTRDGRLKILDFGVAQIERPAVTTAAAEPTLAVTQPGTIIGTPGYMAPEQITGEPATARSDVFAFGLVVYEMLSGTQPFRRRTAPEALTAVLREDAVPLSRAAPAVSPTLGRIIDRCLEKRPADRPGSAADLALYLDAHAAEIGTPASGARPGAPAPPPRRLVQRLMLASAILIMLVVAATWALVQVMAERAATAAVETALSRADSMVRRVHAERLERLVLTSRLVASFPALKALVENTDGPTIRETLVGQQQQIPGAPILVAMSPDGRVLARTDAVAGASANDREWAAALAAGSDGSIVRIGGRTYHAAAAAAEAAASIFGHIVAALPVDETFARAISASTQDETIVLSDDAVLAATLRASDVPWRSLRDWRSRSGDAGRPVPVRIGVQQFTAREIRLASDPAVSVIAIKSRDETVGPYRRIQQGLLVIAVAGVAAAVTGGLWIAAAAQRRYAAAG
jgi:hypothetical protein